MTPMQAILSRTPANENTSVARTLSHDLVKAFIKYMEESVVKDMSAQEYAALVMEGLLNMADVMDFALKTPELNTMSAAAYLPLQVMAMEQSLKDTFPEIYE